MKLLLRNLCEDVCENELMHIFSTYGKVKKAKILRDERNMQSRGVAIVEMEDGGEIALQAMNYSNYKAQYLVVSELTEKE